jgi:hypothetical protein
MLVLMVEVVAEAEATILELRLLVVQEQQDRETQDTLVIRRRLLVVAVVERVRQAEEVLVEMILSVGQDKPIILVVFLIRSVVEAAEVIFILLLLELVVLVVAELVLGQHQTLRQEWRIQVEVEAVAVMVPLTEMVLMVVQAS